MSDVQEVHAIVENLQTSAGTGLESGGLRASPPPPGATVWLVQQCCVGADVAN